MMLLDEPLDGVVLLGVGRKLEELDILGVTLTAIMARQRWINLGPPNYCMFTFTANIPCCVCSGCIPFRFVTSSSMIKDHLNGASKEQMNPCSTASFDALWSKHLILDPWSLYIWIIPKECILCLPPNMLSEIPEKKHAKFPGVVQCRFIVHVNGKNF